MGTIRNGGNVAFSGQGRKFYRKQLAGYQLHQGDPQAQYEAQDTETAGVAYTEDYAAQF